jgi:hypothetical protein
LVSVPLVGVPREGDVKASPETPAIAATVAFNDAPPEVRWSSITSVNAGDPVAMSQILTSAIARFLYVLAALMKPHGELVALMVTEVTTVSE